MSDIEIFHQVFVEGYNFPDPSMAQRLPASRFPDTAEGYVCDQCGRDVTRHLYRAQAHIRQPIGPMRYTCPCGTTYLTGATEWDYLSDWDKRQWRADAGIVFILFVLLLIPVGLGYTAWHQRSVTMLAVFVASMVIAVVFLRLFGLLLVGSVDIARSIWRTRLTKVGRGLKPSE